MMDRAAMDRATAAGQISDEQGSSRDGSVRGERSIPSVHQVRSLQSRVSSAMAFGLVAILGAGMLVWYYTHAVTRETQARRAAHTASLSRAQGEMVLPALEPIVPAARAVGSVPQMQEPQMRELQTQQPRTPGEAPSVSPKAELALAPSQLPLAPASIGMLPSSQQSPLYNDGAYVVPPPKTPSEMAMERRLSGVAFARTSDNVRAEVASTTEASARGDGELSRLLRPDTLTSARAHVLPTQRFLLAKGAFIDCTLETAIDSTLPGMTTCITATDTFGADGSVVLLERGTKLVGQTRGQVQQGAARVFVLWTEARTPDGVIVPLDSPGADELGRSGLSGDVERHFWDRFGAAVLISTIDGAVQTTVQSANRGGGAVLYDPSASQGVLTEVLKGTVNIAPTVIKRNGDRIQVLVARDLDFRSVYELRLAASAR